MANQITDNRTNVTTAESVTNFVDLSGAAAGTLDNEIFIQGSNSVGQYLTSSLDGLLFNTGTTQSWAGSVVYIWINCGIVGLLDTKANGGFRIRFTGATVTNWFEVYVGGSDDWPPAVSGGWVQFVIDVDTARSTAVTNGWTNGTVPTANQIQRVGWAGITGGTMPRMVDNTWMDQITVLGANTPGIIVEGRNGGTTDWASADIATQLGVAVGTFIETTGGAYKINTPIQFGINDTTTHGFTDTNAVWLWDNQEFLPDDFYKISALGNSGGTTNVTFGVKSGTGDDATGSQGIIISAAGDGARWGMDFNDPNLDAIGFYGCLFQHGEIFDMDDPAVSVISTTYSDCTRLNCGSDEQLRNIIVNANTLDGVAFAYTYNPSVFVFCSFNFSDGHAIYLEEDTNTGNSYTFKGNEFSGYGGTGGTNLTPSSGSTDAAIFNDSSEAITLNVTEQGDSPSIRNGASATTTIVNAISITLNNVVAGSRVYLVDLTDTAETVIANAIENSGTFTTSIDFTGTFDLLIRVRKSSTAPFYKTFETIETVGAGGLTLTVNQELDE